MRVLLTVEEFLTEERGAKNRTGLVREQLQIWPPKAFWFWPANGPEKIPPCRPDNTRGRNCSGSILSMFLGANVVVLTVVSFRIW